MAIEKISIEFVSNIKDVGRQLSELDNRIKSLQNKHAEISIKADKLKEARAQIQEIDVQMRKLRAQKAQINVDGTKTEAARKQLEEIDKQLRQLRAQKANLQVVTTELKGADTELKRIETQMRQLNNLKARLQVESEDADETEEGLKRLSASLKELNSSRTNINISSNIEKVGGALNTMGDRVLGMLNPLKTMLGQWVGIAAAVNLVNRAISLVTGSMSDAVSRFDTLRNFPKVMENLGIATGDAEASIAELSDGLKGLPTALDTGAMSIQRFTSKNNDVRKSTKMFLALNNALLAGGADAQIQSSAIEQLTQAYSKGTMDMVEWRSLQMAMPAQLAQTARAMGYSVEELGEGLRTGNIEMESFLDAVIRLNDEGIDGFASFAEQAKSATGGISTGIANMKTAIVRGWTDIYSALDDVLEKAGLDGIAGTIGSIGGAIEGALGKVAQFIRDNEGTIIGFIDKIKAFDWAALWAGLTEGLGEIWSIAKPVLGFIKDMITRLGDGSFEKGLGRLPMTLLKIGIALKVVGTAMKLIAKFSNFQLPSFGKKSGAGGGLGFTFDVGNMLNQLKNLALVWGVIELVKEAAQALKEVDEKVPEDLASILPKLASMGIAIGGMGLIVAAAGKLAKSDYKAAFAGLAVVAGISLNIMLAAEAIKQLNAKVPANIATVGAKIVNMAIALGAMGGIVAIAGTLAKKNPTAAIAGLAVVAGLALELMLVAEAIRQLDEKVPADIGSVASKMASLAVAVGVMGGLIAVVGGIMATGIGAVVIGAGLLAIAGIAADIMLMAEAIQQMNEKVPENFGDVEGKLNTIIDVVKAFTEAGLGNVFDAFNNLFAAVNVGAVAVGIRAMVDVGRSLQELKDVEIPADAIDKVNEMKAVIESVSSESSFWENISSVFANLTELIDIVVIKGMLNKMIDVAKTLSDFDAAMAGLDTESSIEKIGQMKSVLDAISSDSDFWENAGQLFADIAQYLDVAVNGGVLAMFVKIAEVLDDFNTKTSGVDYENAITQIENIQGVLEALASKSDFFEEFSQAAADFVNLVDTAMLTQMLGVYSLIVERLNALAYMDVPDIDGITEKIGEIEKVLDMLATDTEFLEGIGDLLANLVESGVTATIANLLAFYVEIVNKLKEFSAAELDFDMAGITAKIETIKSVMEAIAGEDGFFSTVGKLVTDAFKSADTAVILQMANEFLQIAETLNAFNEAAGKINETATEGAITKIRGLMEKLSGDKWFGEALWSAFTSFGQNLDNANIVAAVEILNSIANELVTLQGQKLNDMQVETVITSINTALTQIVGIPLPDESHEKEFENLLKTVEAIKTVADTLKQIAGSGFDAETALTAIDGVGQVITKLNELPPAESELNITKLVEAFQGLVETLTELADAFVPIGLSYGEQVIQGFNNATVPEKIAEKITEVVNSIKKKTTEFYNAGKSFGEQLVSGFKAGIANLGSSIRSQISGIQSQLNGLSVPNITSQSTSTVYRATGGIIGPARGTDTVPAMLTPGEFVQSRTAVKKFGLDFMKRVNHGDIAGAFKALVSRPAAPPVSSGNVITNNINHANTNNARVNQYINGGNPDYVMSRASRYLGVRT